ncbi:MAG TPA: rRNA adenine N-6-methyltransferase family protein, partial [Thermoplasmata archaeon]|nr:rRNA adenine N-6-methyltransferase family protein [Thermoplasmata archaeon]
MDVSELRQILRELGVRPSKGLGQHFLVDERVAERQIDHARIAPSDVVLEIGPGLGVL